MPYSRVLEKESVRLFRKAMSKENQEAFDRFLDLAKLHTHASRALSTRVYQAHSFPMEMILLSICLEHEKLIEEILRKLKNKGIEKK